MSLSQLIISDVAAVFHNTDDFARTMTLTKPAGGTAEMTANQRISLLGLPPVPDGAISAFDRLQMLGLYRLGESSAGGSASSTITGIVDFDLESGMQGTELDSFQGRRETRMGLLYVAAGVAITTSDKPELCDTITIEGEVWQCLRREGHDPGEQRIVIRRDEKITTKQGRTRQ